MSWKRFVYRWEDFYWNIVYAFQRMFNKYDARSAWGLNSQLQEHILFGVRRMRENGIGHPAWLYKDDSQESYDASMEDWQNILDTIIEGMEAGISVDNSAFFELGEDWDKVLEKEGELIKLRDDALRLVVKHFDDLWD